MLPSTSRGEEARLIPTAQQTELKTTSTTLAVISAVREYAETLLKPLGAPIGSRAKVSCFTELVFNDKRLKNIQDRPDGMICVTNGKRKWIALIEAKVKKEKLKAKQVESYLDICKVVGADCVITISNDFVCDATHSPIKISGHKLRSTKLFHWSWSYLQAEAKIQISQSSISDPDQAYMLNELVRYLSHDSSGVVGFTRMRGSWSDSIKVVQQGKSIQKSSEEAQEIVADWYELIRSVSLSMSERLGLNVSVLLTPSERKNPSAKINHATEMLYKEASLTSRLKVPDAAGPINVTADLKTRCVTVAMETPAPKDKKQSKASIRWLTNQLKNCDTRDIYLAVRWPGRSQQTIFPVIDSIDDPTIHSDERPGLMPSSFEVRYTNDLGGKFSQVSNFGAALEDSVVTFYAEAGQYISAWQAPPPKIKQTDDNPPPSGDS
jgi:hypothetical protein